MKRFLSLFMVLSLLVLLAAPSSAVASRIKDIAHLEGIRDNQLIGYGLVVGLNGTGDSAGTQFTIQSLVNMMERLGVTVGQNQVKVDNVAAVIVTAKLPPFARAGSKIDVLVSSVGDAESLTGGTLLMTPLNAPDGNVYAVAQGPVVVSGGSFGGNAAKVQKNHPTVGRIPDGALVEREVILAFGTGDFLTYHLKEADFTTVSRMRQAVNNRFGADIARPADGGTLQVAVPGRYQGRMVEFVAALEGLEVQSDQLAKIVVNSRTGTIVMGEQVRIDTVAVSHGNLSLVIDESAQVSQPNAFAEGETVVVPETAIALSEDGGELMVLDIGITIGEVARGLNAIGATPRDLIAIFQAIKAAGALHAEMVIL